MDKQILKTVIADNQSEVPKYKVVPRDFTFEAFGNYVFVGIRRAGKTFLLYQRMQQLLAQGMLWDEMLYLPLITCCFFSFVCNLEKLILPLHDHSY